MKKSNAVPLLLLGSTALLAGCTRNDAEVISETRQDAYRTKEACGRDWADDACSHSGGAYVGPRYFYSHGDRTPYIIDNDGRTRAVPGHYGAYNSHRADAAGVPAAAPGRTTTVTHNAGSSSRSSIFRGGFGGGRSSGSFGG